MSLTRTIILSLLSFVVLMPLNFTALAVQDQAQNHDKPGNSDEDGWIEIAVFVHGISPTKKVESSDSYYESLHENIERYYNLLKSPEDKSYPFIDKHRIYVNYGANLPNTIKVTSISDDLAEAEAIIVDLDHEIWNRTKDNPESFYRTNVLAGLREIILYGLSDAVYYLSAEGTREIRGSILNQIYRDLQGRGIIDNNGKLAEDKKLSFTLFAHSLGTVIMYDILNTIYSDFEDLDEIYTEYGSKTIVEGFIRLKQAKRIRVRKLYSFGSQMSLMHFRKENSISETINLQWTDVSKIFGDSEGVADPRWLNFWDKDDILGYPLEFLFQPRAKSEARIVKDIHIDVDDYLPHTIYWFNDEMAFEISRDLLGLTRAEALEILKK